MIRIIVLFALITCTYSFETVIKFKQNLSNEILKEFNSKYNLNFKGTILKDHYIFESRKISKRSIAKHFSSLLKNDPNIKWFEIQTSLKRAKRYFLSDFYLENSEDEELIFYHKQPFYHHHHFEKNLNKKLICDSSSIYFNDPQWSVQWYMNDGCEQGFELNITKAWQMGFSGKGVVLSIIDDGLEKNNNEIIENYDEKASYDLNDNDPDPEPRYDISNENKHGTRCAGEIAAKHNNSFCGVGVAFHSRIGGIRLLDGKITDRLEAEALSFNSNYIDIFSASWGPLDDGKTVDGPGVLSRKAFKNGVKYGRNGRGTIYVWAAGNGGRVEDNCNCDGYTSSIYTITIGSINQHGEMPVYSEKCSAILASTFSSGKMNHNGIITSDLRNTCTQRHTGTSASAPIGAGIIALALEANKNLTWRDVQYLIILTSKPFKLNSKDWFKNGVGRFISHNFGYGLMNAGKMVDAALKWPKLNEQSKCRISFNELDYTSIKEKSLRVFAIECFKCNGVNYLEHVISRISLHSGVRGKIKINLISPCGTKSNLLDFRRNDLSRRGFKSWPFMSVHFWGENPIGIWYLEIINNSNHELFLLDWSLVMYGIDYLPDIR